MRVELNNGITLQMETYYGRIRMRIDIENDAEIRYLICLQCNYHDVAKGGVKAHMWRKRNEPGKSYDVYFTYRHPIAGLSGDYIVIFVIRYAQKGGPN